MRGKMKILLVDDEPVLRELFHSYLSMAGYEEVHTASNGESALNLVQSNGYDAILMDTDMPGRKGFEICSHIRKFNNSIGIFGMSGVDYAREWQDSGANYFLTKMDMTKRDEREKLYASIDSFVE